MKHYVKDEQGSLFEVSDLQAAIVGLAAYLSHLYALPKPMQDVHEQKYLKDIYIKLNHLKHVKENDYAKSLQAR